MAGDAAPASAGAPSPSPSAASGAAPTPPSATGGAPPPALPVPDLSAPPNRILFVENVGGVPAGAPVKAALAAAFGAYPGLVDVRPVATKPRLAFVEYGGESAAAAALRGLQGTPLAPGHPLVISFAKK